MEYQEFLNIVKNPEKEVVELKPNFNQWDEIAETIAAFSTNKGGKVFVGVDRTGIPIGTTCNNEIKGRLHTLAHNEIDPQATISVEILTHDQQKDLVIVIIDVQKGHGVFSYKGVFYKRQGDSNYRLNADEIFNLQKEINKLYFDEMPAHMDSRPALISDLSEAKASIFLRNTKPALYPTNYTTFDMKRFLTNNNLLMDGHITVKNAALMLFGKDPQKFLPQLKISVAVFPSTTITETFSKEEYTGDLFKMLNDSYVGIIRNLKTYSFTEGLKRIDVSAYPLSAIREALTNALVHRDYFDRNTEIFIKIFTDRVEFLNPAKFPFEGASFAEIKESGISKRRNPLIAKFFEDAHLMEQEGRGLTAIKESMKKHGLPEPDYEVGANTFKVILKSPANPEAIKHSPYARVADFSNLNERQQKFIEYLRLNNNVPLSRQDYMTITGTAIEKTASRDLEDLTQRRIISRFGETRGTRYLLFVP